MIGKKYRGESQYGEKVEGWLVRHPLGKVFLIVYKGWDEPRWVAVKEETLEEVPDVEVEFKYNVGDKVYYDGRQYKIKERLVHCGEPSYKFEGHSFVTQEWLIEISAPQDIIECIKTFDDACQWCRENNHNGLVEQYYDAMNVGLQRAKDITAYLQLRIITCALNEGWQATEDERGYISSFGDKDVDYVCASEETWYYCNSTSRLCFRTPELADYAAEQFLDIYEDFCGAKEGCEK